MACKHFRLIFRLDSQEYNSWAKVLGLSTARLFPLKEKLITARATYKIPMLQYYTLAEILFFNFKTRFANW